MDENTYFCDGDKLSVPFAMVLVGLVATKNDIDFDMMKFLMGFGQ